MASSVKRERQLARERYQRQQARRAARAARRRRLQQTTAVVVSVLLVLAGVVFLATVLGGDDASDVAAEPTVSPTASSSAAPSTPAGGCTYTKSADAPAKKVAVPTYDAKQAQQPFSATLKTNHGDIVVEMVTADAPCTTNSFRHLATAGYYDKTPCHRLTTSGLFVLQCGDPSGSGGGGPGYQFGLENSPPGGVYPAGSVAMARTADPDSNGSQFFIVYKETRLPTDSGGYTLFGKVTKGLDVVTKVAAAGVDGGGGDGAPAQKVTIESVTVGKASA